MFTAANGFAMVTWTTLPWRLHGQSNGVIKRTIRPGNGEQKAPNKDDRYWRDSPGESREKGMREREREKERDNKKEPVAQRQLMVSGTPTLPINIAIAVLT